MEIVTVPFARNKEFIEAFIHCMEDLDAFAELSAIATEQGMTLREYAEPTWAACHRAGEVRGIFDEKDRLVAFTLYMRLCTIEMQETAAYESLFTPPFHPGLLHQMRDLGNEMLYLLGIGVVPEYRRRGIARMLINDIIDRYGQYGIMADVSGEISVQMYRDLGFTIEIIPVSYPYFLVYHRPKYNKLNIGIL